MSEGRKCPHCSAPIAENASFCFHCMKSLDDKTVIVKGKKKFPILWVVSAAILLVAVLLTGAYFFLRARGIYMPWEKRTSYSYVGDYDSDYYEDENSFSQNNTNKQDNSSSKNTSSKQNTNDEGNKSDTSSKDGGSFWESLFGKKSDDNSKSGNTGSSSGSKINNSSENNGGSSSSSKPAVSSVPESHSHNYSVSITKTATCGKDGVKEYSCSCGDSYTQTIPATGNHTWGEVSQIIHHDEVGHYENVQESKKVTKYQCAICYQKFSTTKEYYSHFDSAHSPSQQGDPITILRESYTTVSDYEYYYVQKYVVDKKAYDEKVITGYKCSVCGKIK